MKLLAIALVDAVVNLWHLSAGAANGSTITGPNGWAQMIYNIMMYVDVYMYIHKNKYMMHY